VKSASLEIFRYTIPMKAEFKHAAAARDVSEGLLVRLTLSDGTVGWGEAIPRPYVSGETCESAAKIIESDYAARLADDDPLDTKPVADPDGKVQFTSAWCACELAYLDAVCKSSRQRVAGFLARRLGRPQSRKLRRISGIIPKAEPVAAARLLRRMRLYAIRHFKVKVGFSGDMAVLQACAKSFARGIQSGRCSLRVDANGAWSLADAVGRLEEMRGCGVAAIEQPLAKDAWGELAELQAASDIPVMLDESLVTFADAERAVASSAARMFNIRVSKNGGLVGALALADFARSKGIGFQLGCMVGETGILSAAGRVFLELVGQDVRWAENSYGRFILSDDIVRQRVTIGYAGRVRRLARPGLGVVVDERKVERYAKRITKLDF
jgi:muconate cycloisomerase